MAAFKAASTTVQKTIKENVYTLFAKVYITADPLTITLVNTDGTSIGVTSVQPDGAGKFTLLFDRKLGIHQFFAPTIAIGGNDIVDSTADVIVPKIFETGLADALNVNNKPFMTIALAALNPGGNFGYYQYPNRDLTLELTIPYSTSGKP
jgi:hypothetical protein